MEKHIHLLILPLIISNIIHMLVVKYNWMNFLKIPLSVYAFGKNKTLRGFVILTTANGLALMLLSLFSHGISLINSFVLGAILGFSYMVFELPNSYVKRRMKIESGTHPEKRKWLFSLLDKSDSAFGVCLVYYLLGNAVFTEVLLLFLLSVITHISFSYALVKIKLKTSF